jgi:16S rRNA processing protein RimM
VNQIVVGKITGVHGVRGEIKVMPYTQPPEAIAGYQPWLIERPHGLSYSPKLTQFRRQGEGLVVKLEGCDDRDKAKTLVGSFIQVERTCLPALTEGYYWADLIGLQVSTVTGVDLGTLDYLFETGSNDVMMVKGDRERLIPYRPEVVIEVNLEKGTLVVDWDPEF